MRAVAFTASSVLALLLCARTALAHPAGSDATDEDDNNATDESFDVHPPFGEGPPSSSGPSRAPSLGPSIGEVLAFAYAAANLDGDPARSWTRRARLGGLVPWVSIRTGRNTSWQEIDPSIDHGVTYEVRATWRLDRLVFDGRELQASTIDTARRRERRRLASRVIRIYFAWRRATEAARLHPRWTSRAHEAAAELDALTDGWFSHSLESAAATAAATAATSKGRRASETRTARP